MMRAYLGKMLLWCVLGIALILGFAEANEIRRFRGASLRYSTPISGQAAFRARQYSIENDTYWPTFWREGVAEFSNGTRTFNANAISFSGSAAQVWPAEFLAGSPPGAVDPRGAAVSAALAYRLWGSTDIIGMPVIADGKPRVVRGVFEGAIQLALLSYHIEDTSQSWTAVELEGGIPHRVSAERFAVASGLGRPDYVLMGGWAALARFMAVFPMLIPVAYMLARAARFVKRNYRAAVTPAIFAGFLLFAAALPRLLDSLPPWLMPTHWSDFSFWGQLYRQAGDSLREFLRLPPMLRDVELKMHLLRQTGIFMFSVCVSIGCVVVRDRMVEN